MGKVVKDTEEEKGVEESLGRAQEQVPERYSSIHVIAEDPVYRRTSDDELRN